LMAGLIASIIGMIAGNKIKLKRASRKNQ
jgi:hypothetical protein